MATGWHRGVKRERITARLIRRDFGVHILHSNADVVKAVSPAINDFLVDRRMIILGLDQLDTHMPSKAHGDPDI